MIYQLLKMVLTFLFLKKEAGKTKDAFVTAVIPTYNESVETLRKTIQSLTSQVSEIIIVDDGSKKPVGLKHLFGFTNTKLITLERNKGKKEAHRIAAEALDTRTEYVLVADSDTIFLPGFVRNALAQFDDQTGAVVGNIHIQNATGINWIMDKVYYNAFNLWRTALAYFGQVSVCSGAATIFKIEAFKQSAPEYYERKTNVGEDRFRTFLLLRNGWKTKVSENSNAYTESPTGTKFIKQQIRWNKSFWLALFYGKELYLKPEFIPYTFDTLHNAISRIGNIVVFLFLTLLATKGNWEWFGFITAGVAVHGLLTGIYGAVRERNLNFPMATTLWAIYAVFIIAPVNIIAIFTALDDRCGNR